MRAAFEQPVDEPRLDILPLQILDRIHEQAKVLAHRADHAQRKFGVRFDEGEKLTAGDKKQVAILDRARARGIAAMAGERTLGEGLALTENVNHFLRPIGTEAMHIHRALTHDEEATDDLAFAK